MNANDLLELADFDDDWETNPTARLVDERRAAIETVRGLYDFDDDEPTETMGR
jgi:hypothetical protein